MGRATTDDLREHLRHPQATEADLLPYLLAAEQWADAHCRADIAADPNDRERLAILVAAAYLHDNRAAHAGELPVAAVRLLGPSVRHIVEASA